MGLDADVLDCNNAIERLSQPKTPVVSRRDLCRWLRRLWRWYPLGFGGNINNTESVQEKYSELFKKGLD